YLQSCSGGIFEGDDLRLRIAAGEGAAAHVATAASTVVHSMGSQAASQQVELHAREGSFLEYFPDPTILFPRSRLANKVRVRLHADATVILGDALLLHDPRGNGDLFTSLYSETRIEDESGKLLVCDRFRIEGQDLGRSRAGINGNFVAQGTLFAAAPAGSATQLMAAMRDALAGIPDIYAGASLLPSSAGAWMRLLARDAVGLRAGLHAAWAAIRRQLTGNLPMPRRK
ncbi:MAG: urease accessory protein UreD, partial [Betaproteobacteria bacterium]